MTIQSNFMVIAPIVKDRVAALRSLLGEMKDQTGVVDPQNLLVPLGRSDCLHFARFLIVDDRTLDDVMVYGIPRRDFPISLAFLGDCDGGAHEFLADLV